MIQQLWPKTPAAAVILGTGLGRITRAIAKEVVIPFAEIPGFTRTTALAHRGRLICGTYGDVPLILLDGRCHAYEGYSFDEVTLPIHVVHACRADTLIVTNAGGGLNPDYSPGDLMVIDDHINLMGQFMSRATTPCDLPRRIRAVATLYDSELSDVALAVSLQSGFVAHCGVYAAVSGPNYETRAEYSFLRRIGADVVGMSTVPEVHVAARLGMRIAGISTVTNVADTETPESVDAEHVVDAAEQAAPHVEKIIAGILETVRKRP